MSEFTDEQIMHAITRSIADGNFEATVALMQMLAVQAPEKAQGVLDAIDVARRLR